MNTKHTPGNWRFAWHNNHDAQITFACVVLDDEVVVIGHGEEKVAKAHLIAAAPDLLQELKTRADNAEQSAFEDWLRRTTPSGDTESVHRQWEESDDFSDFADEWGSALDAIEKATGASHVHDQ